MKNEAIILFVLLITGIAFSGGFQLSVEPGKNKNEAWVVKTFGCHNPSDATISGTAEGIINGERKSVSLKFNHDKKGVYTLAKQWSDEGVWVIYIKGKYNGMNSNAIIEVDSGYNIRLAKGEAVSDLKVKIVRKDVKPEEITKILNNLLRI